MMTNSVWEQRDPKYGKCEVCGKPLRKPDKDIGTYWCSMKCYDNQTRQD